MSADAAVNCTRMQNGKLVCHDASQSVQGNTEAGDKITTVGHLTASVMIDGFGPRPGEEKSL